MHNRVFKILYTSQARRSESARPVARIGCVTEAKATDIDRVEAKLTGI